jgi:hypothetical protein
MDDPLCTTQHWITFLGLLTEFMEHYREHIPEQEAINVLRAFNLLADTDKLQRVARERAIRAQYEVKEMQNPIFYTKVDPMKLN